jgi:quercetin dioxygenase-like cupin family protein
MPLPRFHPSLAALVAASTMLLAPAIVRAAGEARETVTPAFSHPIMNVPGKSITSLVVTYPPGAKTPPHRHGRAFVVAYVLEGSIRSKVDGVEKVYKAGESWTERPGAHHQVSENASATEPAKLMAYLIADSKAKDLLVFDSDARKKK